MEEITAINKNIPVGTKLMLDPMADGKLSPEATTHVLLLDVRSLLHSIRTMLLFLTVLAAVGLVVGVIVALSQAR